jgi:hypothetical protein
MNHAYHLPRLALEGNSVADQTYGRVDIWISEEVDSAPAEQKVEVGERLGDAQAGRVSFLRGLVGRSCRSCPPGNALVQSPVCIRTFSKEMGLCSDVCSEAGLKCNDRWFPTLNRCETLQCLAVQRRCSKGAQRDSVVAVVTCRWRDGRELWMDPTTRSVQVPSMAMIYLVDRSRWTRSSSTTTCPVSPTPQCTAPRPHAPRPHANTLRAGIHRFPDDVQWPR